MKNGGLMVSNQQNKLNMAIEIVDFPIKHGDVQ